MEDPHHLLRQEVRLDMLEEGDTKIYMEAHTTMDIPDIARDLPYLATTRREEERLDRFHPSPAGEETGCPWRVRISGKLTGEVNTSPPSKKTFIRSILILLD